MAHALGLHVIAEGVETEVQHERLVELGCPFGQGYRFAHPLPVEDASALVLQGILEPIRS
jgi:EAL domain-containing protein (putative c-di-GMP-specific phosphodiesterase class I)